MPLSVAVPPALAMPLRNRDDEERPAVRLQRPANDRLAIPFEIPLTSGTSAARGYAVPGG